MTEDVVKMNLASAFAGLDDEQFAAAMEMLRLDPNLSRKAAESRVTSMTDGRFDQLMEVLRKIAPDALEGVFRPITRRDRAS